MTITQRKRPAPEEQPAVEPGLHITCDSCLSDLTHSVRIKCADPACEVADGVDICPSCFCSGKEFGTHLRGHAYRVVQLHSYPIFTADWGADEEVLLLEGLSLKGLGNWLEVANHVGTRTKEEMEEHYYSVYVNSPNWPMPPMDRTFDIDPEVFQARKRRRIANMSSAPIPPPEIPPTSAPGVHEVQTYLPGRLEFEHELDNDAEDNVKDLEFGVCLLYGGDEIPEDENDAEVKARRKWFADHAGSNTKDLELPNGNGHLNGISNVASPSPINGHSDGFAGKQPNVADTDAQAAATEVAEAEVVHPPPTETQASLSLKLALLEIYLSRVQKRHEGKALMLDRGLLEYKKMQAADKKRPKDEREIVHRLRCFAKLQGAEDYEKFVDGVLYEAILRKRIQELQHYRRLGLTSSVDIERYEQDFAKRMQTKANMNREYSSQLRGSGRQSTHEPEGGSHSRDTTPFSNRASMSVGPALMTGRKAPPPLNLANAPSLHLLTPAEQLLCSQIRVLPKAFLVMKDVMIREFVRREGKLRKREARELIKIDVNKSGRVWDYLAKAGFLKLPAAPEASGSGEQTKEGEVESGSQPPQAVAEASGSQGSHPPSVTVV